MSDRTALLQQMFNTNSKMLEKYVRENNVEQIAVYQGKVDKLRQQLLDAGVDVGGAFSQPQQNPTYTPPANFQPPAPSFQQQPTQNQFNVPPSPGFSQPPPQSFHQPPPSSFQSGPPDLARIDQEMQELRLANARLREQISQKEDAISKESRMHAMQAGEMNQRIQELQQKQASFHALVAEKQAKIDEIEKEHLETEKRNAELLNQQSTKSASALRAKEVELDEKVALLAKAHEQIESLTEELKAQEQSASSQIRIVTEERDKLQESVDFVRAQIRVKQEQIDHIQQTLANLKKAQEDEAQAVGVFVTKSIGAINLAVSSSQTQTSTGPLEITAKANVGFANLSITTLVEKTD